MDVSEQVDRHRALIRQRILRYTALLLSLIICATSSLLESTKITRKDCRLEMVLCTHAHNMVLNMRSTPCMSPLSSRSRVTNSYRRRVICSIHCFGHPGAQKSLVGSRD
jgi:hypothetical protein